jgi:hypothetical protein
MSDEKRIDRRSLFDAFRQALGSDEPRAAPRRRAGFSLSAFYDKRERDEPSTEGAPFPHVVLREGIATAATTRVGAGPTGPEPEPPKGPPRGGVA